MLRIIEHAAWGMLFYPHKQLNVAKLVGCDGLLLFCLRIPLPKQIKYRNNFWSCGKVTLVKEMGRDRVLSINS